MFLPILFLSMFILPSPANSSGPEQEARAAALLANCKTSKLTVIRRIPGDIGEVIYKAQCSNYPNQPDMFVRIACRQNMCFLLTRPSTVYDWRTGEEYIDK